MNVAERLMRVIRHGDAVVRVVELSDVGGTSVCVTGFLGPHSTASHLVPLPAGPGERFFEAENQRVRQEVFDAVRRELGSMGQLGVRTRESDDTMREAE